MASKVSLIFTVFHYYHLCSCFVELTSFKGRRVAAFRKNLVGAHKKKTVFEMLQLNINLFKNYLIHVFSFFS